MGRLGWTIAFAAALSASVAPAQFVSDAEPFVEAVRDSDGGKAMALLGKQPQLVNRHNERGETPLVVAIANRNDLWAHYLLSKGADANLAQRDGETPLIAAARLGMTEMAQLLLKAGAKVNDANRRGETPLIVAVNYRQLPMVRLLMTRGRTPTTRTAMPAIPRGTTRCATREREISSQPSNRPRRNRRRPRPKTRSSRTSS